MISNGSPTGEVFVFLSEAESGAAPAVPLAAQTADQLLGPLQLQPTQLHLPATTHVSLLGPHQSWAGQKA